MSSLYRHIAIILLIIFMLAGGWSASGQESEYPKRETDSLYRLVNQCPSDTGKFKILTRFFWKHENELLKYKHIGNEAYRVIQKTNSKTHLLDGLFLKAYIFSCEKKYDSALLIYNQAISCAKAVRHKNLAKAYSRAGDTEFNLNNYAQAKFYFKLAISNYLNQQNGKSAAQVVFSLSRAYEALNQPDSAVACYNKYINYFKQRNDTLCLVHIYMLYSQFLKRNNNIQQSIESLKEALRLAEKAKKPDDLIWVYSSVGDFLLEERNTNSYALAYYQKALSIAELNLKRYYHLINLYNAIGSIYLEQGNYRLALQYNLKGLEAIKPFNHRHYTGNAYKCLGNNYIRLGRYDSAMYCFKATYNTGCQECAPIAFHDVMLRIGDLFILTHKPDSALAWYQKAYNLAIEWESMKAMSENESRLAYFYSVGGNYSKAEAYARKALSNARKCDNARMIRNAADSLSEICAKRKNMADAFYFAQIARRLTDSLLRAEKQIDYNEFAINLEFGKIKAENETRQALAEGEIKRQKIFRNSLIIISMLLLVFAAYVFVGYRRKKKDYLQLCEKNNLIEEKNQEILAQVEEITGQRNEISAQKDELADMSRKLHETDRMKLRFFSNISHEIRTPLTLIINPLQSLMANFKGSEEQLNQLRVISNNTNRLHELTNQILDLQKLDSGALQLQVQDTDIAVLLREIASSFEGFCNKTSCKLKLSLPFSSAVCAVDKDKLTKIISNLLSNAFKFSDKAGDIELVCRLESNSLTISVSDCGKGIPSEQLENVFNRYYQLENSNTQYEGTGIGLAYVKELVELMAGKVHIKSELGKGTLVKVDIPVRGVVVADSKSVAVTYTPSLVASGRPSVISLEPDDKPDDAKPSLLIVEDNDDLRAMVGNIFKAQAQLVFAANGDEGIERARKYIPDLIISDIMMPGTNGIELCRQLKDDVQTSHIPIVFLTAKDNVDSQLEGYRSGVDDYMLKPFEPALLKMKVENMLATRAAARKHFNFEIDHPEKPGSLSAVDSEFLKKCIDSIKQNMSKPEFTVDNLADSVAFSRRNFYRKIKALTAYNPAEFIRYIRMQHAAHLLKNSNLHVFEVADEVGYNNTNNFSQAFKKQFGVLPSDYIGAQ